MELYRDSLVELERERERERVRESENDGRVGAVGSCDCYW